MTTEIETHKPPLPLFILRLRAVVLALGESASPSWWKTEFMNETGLRFLERLYAWTTVNAAVHAAGTAACDAHDRTAHQHDVTRALAGLETEPHWPKLLDEDCEVIASPTDLGSWLGTIPEKLAGLLRAGKRIEVAGRRKDVSHG
ncbi:MAG: BrxE family protein [Verrucomicrobiota bacterium]|nr:BrxE family protein [Verrucomicrobiota bacterium]